MDSFNTNTFDYNLLTNHDNDAQNKLIFEPTITYSSNDTNFYTSNNDCLNSQNYANDSTILQSSSVSNLTGFNEDYYTTKTYYNSNNDQTNRIYSNTNETSNTLNSFTSYDDQHKLTQMNNVDFNQYNTNYTPSTCYNYNYSENWNQSKPSTSYSTTYSNYFQTNSFQSNDLNSLSSSTPSLSSSSSSSSSTSSPNNKEFTDLTLLKPETFNSTNAPLPQPPPPPLPQQIFNSKEIKLEPHYSYPGHNFTKSEPSQSLKRKLSDTETESKLIYSLQCNVCDKIFNSSNTNSINNQTCEACKHFFRRYTRKLADNLTRPLCNQNCYLNKDKRNICHLCKYEKCLSVGLSLENETTSKIVKLELDDDLNLNQNSLNEMRNLSIEVVLSSSSSSSSPNEITSNSDFTKLLLKEIELRKTQIRLEQNEQRIKFYLAEMSAKMSSYLINNLKLNNDSFTHLISQKTKKLFNNDTSNKQLLIAYQCLIDENLNFNSTLFDLRIKNLLDKIYSNSNLLKANNMSYYSNLNGSQHHFLTELKLFHFLLLLFSSFQTLDDFIRLDASTDKSNNLFNNELNYCQKSIIKLIDCLCEDKFVKTQILLSVSEIDFF